MTIKRLLAFGDSFVLGELDDFGPGDINYNADFPPNHNMGYYERIEYLKYNISFASLIARYFKYEFINYAYRGSSNYLQLDRLMNLIHKNELYPTDVILFGITTTVRDRISIIPQDWNPKSYINLIDPNMICRSWKCIEHNDLFFILSTLDTISKQYNVPIIKFHLFDNNINKNILYPHDNFLGWGFENNTLLDILDDTWCCEVGRPSVHHSKIKPKSGYEQFYTWNGHPSELGHKKLARWFIDNNILKI
jgi:hypothetical protein